MDYFIAILLFAISSSITPGPNNVLVMTSGLNFGVKRSMPLLCGICFGFTVMLLIVGIGFMQVFTYFPSLHLVIKTLGVGYLLYLAYLIANSSNAISSSSQPTPLSFLNGALFQWINAKAWIVASGAIAAFTTVNVSSFEQQITIALIFLFVSFPCVGIWLLFGSVLKRHLTKPRYLICFNYTMSLLLILSVLPVVNELIDVICAALFTQ
ncbi:LysE family translocator [Pseudoalteromonas sp. JBTF-M23]|uniref:LysE family translocator n=1 Tax=Pseudoalteromonas caenipelagi TaxID=2726988 RepID=A0A849V8J8_9GAMM|nr:LysE family translocator [Pseudoalteromonas caenipelagi]NOU49258.1 LysE family translocator [Pseudoalteromonas caenipelagi]